MYSAFDTGKTNGLIEKTRVFFKCCKWAWQRVKRGYSDYDLMDTDVFLEELIPDMLSRFRDRKTPGQFPVIEELFDEAGISVDDYMDMQGRTDDEAEKKKEEMDNMLSSKWDEILSRIIFCFNEQSEDKCSKQNEYEEAFRESRYQDEELKKKYHKKEKELEKYRNKMREEGFELLCRYFHALWY